MLTKDKKAMLIGWEKNTNKNYGKNSRMD